MFFSLEIELKFNKCFKRLLLNYKEEQLRKQGIKVVPKNKSSLKAVKTNYRNLLYIRTW